MKPLLKLLEKEVENVFFLLCVTRMDSFCLLVQHLQLRRDA